MNEISVENRLIDVLHIEDDDDHVELVRTAVQMAQIPFRLSRAKDSDEANQLLQSRRGAHSSNPDAIILDMTAQYSSGLDLLDEIKRNPHLKGVSVFILTTLDFQMGIVMKYDLKPNSWYKKPAGINGYIDVMRSIAQNLRA